MGCPAPRRFNAQGAESSNPSAFHRRGRDLLARHCSFKNCIIRAPVMSSLQRMGNGFVVAAMALMGGSGFVVYAGAALAESFLPTVMRDLPDLLYDAPYRVVANGGVLEQLRK
jgi:hypothetical protein